MQQTLNPTEISELIRKRVEQFDVSSQARTEGTVVSVSDGICRLHGLADAMQGEMIEFPGDTYGGTRGANLGCSNRDSRS